MSASNSNRLEEGLAAGLAITRNPTYEDVASPRSLTCTTRPKPTCILRTRQSTRPTKSSANRPQAQQRRVQFSDVVAGTIVDSLADLSAEEKRCVWYCVSIDYTYMYILPAVFLGVTTDMTLISNMLYPSLHVRPARVERRQPLFCRMLSARCEAHARMPFTLDVPRVGPHNGPGHGARGVQ